MVGGGAERRARICDVARRGAASAAVGTAEDGHAAGKDNGLIDKL